MVSIKVMTQVWESAPVSGGSLLVLLALADFSNDQRESWPAIATLAAKARLSESQTQRVLRELEAADLISVAPGSGPHGTNRYTVQIAGGRKLRGVASAPDSISEGGRMGATQTVIEPSVAISKPKHRSSKAIPRWVFGYPRSDNDEQMREPDAPCEQWLWIEAINKWGQGTVAKGKERFGDNFFVWRKAKDRWESGGSSLRQCLGEGLAEYQDECWQIMRYQDRQSDAEDTAEGRNHAYRIAERYRHIDSTLRAGAKEEYDAWVRENYPETKPA